MLLRNRLKTKVATKAATSAQTHVTRNSSVHVVAPQTRRPTMDDDATDVLHGLTAEQLSGMTGVHVTTCRRWVRTKRLPPLASKLLRILVLGDLSLVHRAWRGWNLMQHGELVSPERWSFRPGEILSIPFTRQLAMSYQRQLRAAKQVDFIEGRYVEPDETRMTDAMKEARYEAPRLHNPAPASVGIPERQRRRAAG